VKALPKTFRGRLTLGYSLVLTLILAAFGVSLYFIVRGQLLRHHDRELTETAAAIQAVIGQHEDCEHLTPEQVAQLNQYSKLALFHSVDGDPAVFYRSPDLESLPVARDLAARPQFLEERSVFRTYVEKGGLLRVYTRPYRSHAGRQGVIRVMERIGDVELPLSNLRVALLLLAPIAVAGSAAISFWLAGRALAPVVEITELAREIESTQLSRRLPTRPVPDEIGRLVDTFNQMIARLESSFEAMKRFTADASHELRSPLTNVKSTVELALDRPRDASEYRAALASVGEEAERLRRIVEDLLLLARADSGRLPFEREPVRLDVIGMEVAESFGPRARESGLRVEAEGEPGVVVSGDERWLRQLVQNLVENAVRFSPLPTPEKPAPCVVIKVRADGRDALLTVEDEGPGIPEEERERIFERFYRVDTSRHRDAATGAGLGLAICSWIVEAHRGRIEASERQGGGTVISVRFAGG
jgi:two-component system, OmpR family, sensor kinase